MDMIKRFTANDNFMGRYEKLIKDVVIPYQEKVLHDNMPDIPKSHCIENFEMAARLLETGNSGGDFYGMVFQDSDLAKWLEGAAYSLLMYPDKELESRCDEVIDIIGRAQHEDGYLNTYFTLAKPEKRWTNLAEGHELYCAGHMIEAAVAYAMCTGKTKLLSIMCKMADHIYNRFITEKTEGYPGHPEIELALMRLYRFTNNEKYLELALHFINIRGVDSDYYIKEREKSSWTVWGSNPHDKEYTQSHIPVREQTKATGHAVRAVYLYAGMADAAKQTGDQTLVEACRRLWDNITESRMYVTGAIGSSYEGEAFTKDYHLPNDTAYGETCAAIGLIFFAQKMLRLEKAGRYADVMERALYNCVLAGMELDGTKFFYVNPLEVIPGISGEAKTHVHTLPQRPGWFTCSCCPPNVARLLPSIAEYAWEIAGNTLYSHLYIGGILDASDIYGGKIIVETAYPYEGSIAYRFVPEGESMDMTLAIRLPAWSKKTDIQKNGLPVSYEIRDGYAYISGSFVSTDIVTAEFDMSVQKIYADTRVSDDNGKIALSRGPLIYCAEGMDNDGDVLSLRVKRDGNIDICEYDEDKLMGICELKADGVRIQKSSNLYSYEKPKEEAYTITFIPYYAWCNRGLNEMRVWLPEQY